MTLTKEHRSNISKSMLGKKNSLGYKHTKETLIKRSIASSKVRKNWNDLDYRGKHLRIYKLYGKASKCDFKNCTSQFTKRYEWANLSGKYKEQRTDWIMSCVTCHKKYDKRRIKL